ncbi:hypothetical protein DENSPDRAFT_427732 [Dentipellis sp. KUC8613]|nr:hypothetical protein DENSPDRAFT_427732 [Dentipellis sp. KUC8613]
MNDLAPHATMCSLSPTAHTYFAWARRTAMTITTPHRDVPCSEIKDTPHASQNSRAAKRAAGKLQRKNRFWSYDSRSGHRTPHQPVSPGRPVSQPRPRARPAQSRPGCSSVDVHRTKAAAGLAPRARNRMPLSSPYPSVILRPLHPHHCIILPTPPSAILGVRHRHLQ